MAIRKTAFIALLAVLVSGPAIAQQWIEYRPDGMGYRIEMPKQWTIEKKAVPTDIGDIEMVMATVDGGSKAYMSIHSVFPKAHIDKTPPDRLLDNARDGAVKNVNGKLLSEQKLTIGGYPARHLVVDAPAARVSQRLVLAGAKLVQAIYVGKAGDETQADTLRFFTSFSLTEPLPAP